MNKIFLGPKIKNGFEKRKHFEKYLRLFSNTRALSKIALKNIWLISRGTNTWRIIISGQSLRGMWGGGCDILLQTQTISIIFEKGRFVGNLLKTGNFSEERDRILPFSNRCYKLFMIASVTVAKDESGKILIANEIGW